MSEADNGADPNAGSKRAPGWQSERGRIDEIDREIVRLLADRMAAVREIGAAKGRSATTPLRDFDRERAVSDRWTEAAAEHELSGYYVGRVLREVLNYSRRIQEGLLDRGANDVPNPGVRVGYQGVPGAYSHLALQKLFHFRGGHSSVDPIGFRSFGEAVDALEAGDVEYALLPIENTIAGSLNEVYHLLATRPVTIVDEEIWPVEHCLVGLPGATVEQIRTIRSHPVALQQCGKFLASVGHARSASHFDTAASAQSLLDDGDPSVAAICSEEIARTLELPILRRDIADTVDNFTRFILLSKQAEPIDSRVPIKTSFIVTVNHRRGALADCLQSFARHGINLTKLESRPKPESPWEYLFYIDIEADPKDPTAALAIQEVRGHTNHFKVLGTYPRRTVERDASEPRGRTRSDEAEPIAVAEPSPATPQATVEPPPERTPVQIGGVEVGGSRFVVI
ncbi:MAG: bifunctional chorismate mutase/prephenate dehydratase, partial [Planctomycetota bacterium]